MGTTFKVVSLAVVEEGESNKEFSAVTEQPLLPKGPLPQVRPDAALLALQSDPSFILQRESADSIGERCESALGGAGCF